MTAARDGVVTVTLNAALDHTVECAGFTAGALNRITAQALTAGGKGVNVAAFLAGRIAPVTATGFLGRDNEAPFQALFHDRGVHDRCLRLPGKSRVNLKVVDRPAERVTEINFPGLSPSAADLAQLFAEIDALARENRWFVLAGSVPGGAPEGVYADLVRRLHAKGCFVAVDGSGAALRRAVEARPDLIKPNRDELAELLGRRLATREEVVRAGRELQSSGIGLVVVSLGADGAVLVDGERALLATPPAVDVATTVGAGDALLSGVLAARIEGGDLEACARLGTAFAVAKLGAFASECPAPARLEALLASVRIESLGAG